MKATVPVGVPSPGAMAATTATKSMGVPSSAGLGLELSEVIEFAMSTVCVSGADVDVAKSASPL
ncbi:hypothetical protein [Streptomyces malaysiensis]|uniref:hypothetical protein n=1 Tax=Streptomyces malaysiensis TaxID=92644 RepID=UPI003720F430